MVVTNQIIETMTTLIEKTLTYFFAISMMYLGVNVGQKIGFAVSDAFAKPEKKAENSEGNQLLQ